MIGALAALLGGLALLYGGAEALVRGAVRLARALGVSPLVIGLTVVAFGTSFPELSVSTIAALRGQSDVAVGNVVGSNIFNVALILGAAALARPLRVELRLVRLEIPLLIAVSIGFLALAWDGSVSRLDGGILLGAFLAYLASLLRGSRDAPAAVESEFRDYEPTTLMIRRLGGAVPTLLLIAAGLAGLVLGARLLVESAVGIARGLGITEFVIGVTIVAAGTSLPELATSVVAARNEEADISVGNVVGSNLFNLLAILGIAALVRPLVTAPGVRGLDGLVMVGIAALLLPMAGTRGRLGRLEGGVLVAAYAAYLLSVLARAGS